MFQREQRGFQRLRRQRLDQLVIYQWFQNGAVLSNGTGVSSANSNVLTLTAVTTNNAGNYTMTVTNTYGNATSEVLATLIVQVPPD